MVVEAPPYRVPSIAEIRAVPSNGYTMVSTFSGCGGSCTGFRYAGFEIPYASEFIEAARDSYAANFPTTHIDPRDIRDVNATEILKRIGRERDDVDLLEGSPPCASFSITGARQRGWGHVNAYSDSAQRTDDLFYEYARLVDGLRPRVLVAENVTGLVIGKAKGYFKQIHAALADVGYRVEARIVDASWLGVPQARRRLIFVGVRNDLVDATGTPLVPTFPVPFPYRYTVRDAIPWIDDGRHASTDTETGQSVLLGTSALGRAWDELETIGKYSKRYRQLVKVDPDRPSPTITTKAGFIGAAGVTHPYERRHFTLEELRALSSFPSDFVLTGNFRQRAERIGRSVPPMMAYAIARTIRDEILERVPR